MLRAFTTFYDVALFIGGVRIFRASGEPVDPPRAWWRATGRAPASFVWAVAFALWGAAALIGFLRVDFPWLDLGPEALAVSLVARWGVALFYLQSGIRLAIADSEAA